MEYNISVVGDSKVGERILEDFEIVKEYWDFEQKDSYFVLYNVDPVLLHS